MGKGKKKRGGKPRTEPVDSSSTPSTSSVSAEKPEPVVPQPRSQGRKHSESQEQLASAVEKVTLEPTVEIPEGKGKRRPQKRPQSGAPQSVPPPQQQGGAPQPPQQQRQHGDAPQFAPQHQQQRQQGGAPQPSKQQRQYGDAPQFAPQHQQQRQQGGAPQPAKQQRQHGGAPQFAPQQQGGVPQSAQEQRQQGGAAQQQLQRASSQQQSAIVPITAGTSPQLQPQLTSIKRTGGRLGHKIGLLTNHFPLSLGKVTRAVHYDVSIEPDRPKKLYRAVMEAFRVRYYANRFPAFDGSANLYSSSQLPPPLPKLIAGDEFTGEVKIIEDGREKEFKVTVKFATWVDLTIIKQYETQKGGMPIPMQALQCLDVVLRSAPALSCIPCGRSFFTLPRDGSTYSLGDGSELYYGFYQSAILGWKPFLNVDVAHKAFPMALNIVDLIQEIAGDRVDLRSELHPRDLEAVNRHVRLLKVQYEIPGHPGSRRVYRVNELDSPPARATFKQDEHATPTTVLRYFQSEKKVQVKYPNLPCLWVGSRMSDKKILLPSEFCTILRGQAVNRKMTENQTRNLIKKAATNTEVRMSNIRMSVSQANYNRNSTVREFDLSVNENPQELTGRVLQPPDLKYRDKVQRVFKGTWRASSFQKGADLRSWTILNLDRRIRDDLIMELERQIINCSRALGMTVSAAYTFSRLQSMGRTLLQDLKGYFKEKKNHQLVVVVIPDHNFVYNYVKQASELAVGCLTQCIKGNTVLRLNRSTVDNILLKINAKLDHLNHSLNTTPPCLTRPCIIMGADVTHPSPDSRGIPSVAAVTASFEMKAFKYNFCWRLQDPTQEIIVDLSAITRQHLMFFHDKNNGMKPERIIFFRDGVSDGQFDQVLNIELRAIRAACSSLDPCYKPKITFLVVQKRHHTRFFPTNSRDSEDRNMNVPAGTCVDTIITHPSAQDFYLVSHASIQGVAKPTKYRTLWDDANMDDDELEHLTYYLCHLFARCTRSVSYPAPTYYAHLAAARAKVYCETENIDMSNLQEETKRLKVQDCIIKDLPMYFV